jgi:hypothetical protein
VLTLFIGGMLSLFIGIIAEYVWRIAEHSRHRPRYIIARRYGGALNQPEGEPKDLLHIDVSSMDPRPGLATRSLATGES